MLKKNRGSYVWKYISNKLKYVHVAALLLDQVRSISILGLIINEPLTWIDHINNLSKKKMGESTTPYI